MADFLVDKQTHEHDPWRRIVLENALDAVVGMDQNCTIIDWNRQAEVIFGWTKDEAIGRNLTETLIPPQYRDAHTRGLKHFLASGVGPILNHRVEIEALHRNGSLFPVELTIIPLRLGSSHIFYSFLRDISERKRIEREREWLRERSSFLSEVTKVLLADPLGLESRLQKLMRAVVPKLSDWCTVDLLQSSQSIDLIVVHHSDPKKVELARELRLKYPLSTQDSAGPPHVMRTGRLELVNDNPDVLLQLLSRDEEHFRILKELGFRSYLCVPLHTRGHLLGTLTFVMAESGRHFEPEDVSLAEELAERASSAVDNAILYDEANEAIRVRDEFLSIASHELKTPITSLKLQTQMNKRRIDKGDVTVFEKKAVTKFIESTDRQTDRLSKLVEDMLDISRIAHGKLSIHPEEVDLGVLVREVIDRFDEQLKATGCRYGMYIESSIVGHWDRYRIEQVVINLLTNAMKYGAGKPIEISVRHADHHAVILVTDHGMGIAQENLDRIFQRFERAIAAQNISGLGLGLYICKQIVAAHDGKITVESEIDKGSTFKVELPLGLAAPL